MLTNDRIKYTSSPLTDKKRSQYRQLTGQLDWITNMTKLEFSFEVCYTSTTVNSATISGIIKLNKVLEHVKSEKPYIKVLEYILTQVSTTFPMEEVKVDK